MQHAYLYIWYEYAEIAVSVCETLAVPLGDLNSSFAPLGYRAKASSASSLEHTLTVSP